MKAKLVLFVTVLSLSVGCSSKTTTEPTAESSPTVTGKITREPTSESSPNCHRLEWRAGERPCRKVDAGYDLSGTNQ